MPGARRSDWYVRDSRSNRSFAPSERGVTPCLAIDKSLAGPGALRVFLVLGRECTPGDTAGVNLLSMWIWARCESEVLSYLIQLAPGLTESDWTVHEPEPGDKFEKFDHPEADATPCQAILREMRYDAPSLCKPCSTAVDPTRPTMEGPDPQHQPGCFAIGCIFVLIVMIASGGVLFWPAYLLFGIAWTIYVGCCRLAGK